ncbi:MAG: DNA polymerase III subunit delta' [Oscillospiraceae bacterium]
MQMLTSAVNGGRLCHAYLFYGNKGIGKKTFAKYFACGILCNSKTKPCFECSSCKNVLENNHPDLFISEEKTTKNSISIDEIRFIRQDAYILPNQSNYKVYIIPSAENMTIPAANAFLKVLEEPPKSSIFILTSANKEQLPKTILSRCISFPIFPLSVEEMHQAINDDEKAKNSNGILGEVLKDFPVEQEIANDVFNAIENINEYEILLALQKASSDRAVFNCVVSKLMNKVHDILMDKYNGQSRLLCFSLSYNKLLNLYDTFQQAYLFNGSNANINLLINWLYRED